MKTVELRFMLTSILVASLILSIPINLITAKLPINQSKNDLAQTPSIAIIIGNESFDQDAPLQIRRMLENKGLLYDIIRDSNLPELTIRKFNLILVLGSTRPQLNTYEADLRNQVRAGTGLIWIGQNLPENLYDLLGLNLDHEQEYTDYTLKIKYNNTSTKLFNETINIVNPAGAVTKGQFVDNSNNFVAPAELSFKQEGFGLTYYFAYEVCSWWFADQSTPWLRAHRLHLAIEDVLSEKKSIRLSPYPQGMQSAFITRIEDVDPFHTNQEWINRATNFLNYYSTKNAPLTIALTPRYIDSSLGLNIGIDSPSAVTLREWFSNVLLKGGTIVEHGYTHQIGDAKTGVGTEFYDTESQKWLSLTEQMQRISNGAYQINQALNFNPKGFEAPHYMANNDTYLALSELGFKYVTHNSNTPFFDQYNLTKGLVNIPETLGYIPFNATKEIEIAIKSNMDIIFDMGGVMLYFNHLFDDSMLTTGKNLLDYISTKDDVWITNTDTLAEFWIQRLNAYEQMNASTFNKGEYLKISLGPSNLPGLTLNINGESQIKSVKINDTHWPVFKDNQVILPVLNKNSNTIIINFSETNPNSNQTYGYLIILISLSVSFFLIFKSARTNRFHAPPHSWRKHE